MAIEDALNRLGSEVNAQLAWAFGDVSRAWASRGNLRTCVLLLNLEANHPNLAGWNELVRKTRLALADEAELRTKAGLLLSPAEIRFNDVMEDFIAEMHAAQYLRSLGHADIHFLAESDTIRTDLQSRGGECVYVTEAKNLREPRALTKIAFSRWNARKAAEPGSYEFMASLVAMDDPLDDLTIEQANAVDAIIDELPRWKRPSQQQRQLPGGAGYLSG